MAYLINYVGAEDFCFSFTIIFITEKKKIPHLSIRMWSAIKDVELETVALTKAKLYRVRAACSCRLLQARLVLRDRQTSCCTNNVQLNAFKAGTSLVLAGFIVSLRVRFK